MEEFPFNVIISHGPCVDGVTAAWIVWRSLPDEYKEKLAEYGGSYADSESGSISDGKHSYPVNSLKGAALLQKKGLEVVFAFAHPNEEIPLDLIKNKNVLYMDIDPNEQLPMLIEHCSFLTIVDHHDSTSNTLKFYHALIKKNEEKLNIIVEGFNKKKSAANMIWELISDEKVPDLVEIVRIGDTWDFEETNIAQTALKARHVLKALKIEKAFRSFDIIEETYMTWKTKFPKYVEMGKIANKYENNLIAKAAKKVALGYIVVKDGTIYNVAYTAANILHSEIGAALRYYAEQRFDPIKIDFCATWKYVPHEEIVSVSLRSPSLNIDLAEIAKNIENTDAKGGGHYDAASFTFKGIENFHLFFKRSRDSYRGKNYDPNYNKKFTQPAVLQQQMIRGPPYQYQSTPYYPSTNPVISTNYIVPNRLTNPVIPASYIIPTRGSNNMTRTYNQK